MRPNLVTFLTSMHRLKSNSPAKHWTFAIASLLLTSFLKAHWNALKHAALFNVLCWRNFHWNRKTGRDISNTKNINFSTVRIISCQFVLFYKHIFLLMLFTDKLVRVSSVARKVGLSNRKVCRCYSGIYYKRVFNEVWIFFNEISLPESTRRQCKTQWSAAH